MIKYLNNKLNRLDEHSLEVMKKSFSSSIVKVLGMIAAFLLSILLGRTLGADGLGIINLSNSIINMLVMFCLLGTRQIIIKEVALGLSKNNFRQISEVIKSAYVLNGFFTFLISLILILLLPWIIGNFFDDPRLKWPLIIGLIVIIPQIFARIWSSALIGYRKIWQSNLVDQGLALIITLLLIGVFWISEIKITIISTAIAYALARLIVSIVIALYWKKIQTKVSNLKLGVSNLLQKSFPLFISSISNVLISNIGIILLGFFLNSTSVGFYTVASQIALLSGFMLQITNSSLSGNLSVLYTEDRKQELQTLITRITKYLTIIGIFPLFIFFFFGDDILSLWGKEFINSYMILLILALGQFVNVATGAAGRMLVMCGFQKEESYINIVFMILNIILNVVLINYFGVIGAALTTAFTFIGINITRVIVSKRKTGILTLGFKI